MPHKIILAIDPGSIESGWCKYDRVNDSVIASGVSKNDSVLEMIRNAGSDIVAIEMIANCGQVVGRDIFETVLWTGRFVQAYHNPYAVMLIYRRNIKMHLCGSMRAKDKDIRQALIDRLGPPGTKDKKGATYGVKTHAWSALAVAITACSEI